MARSQGGAARLAAVMSLQTPCHGEIVPSPHRMGLPKRRCGLLCCFYV
jgi:hypothetical protein